jgi:hypothetical protein
VRSRDELRRRREEARRRVQARRRVAAGVLASGALLLVVLIATGGGDGGDPARDAAVRDGPRASERAELPRGGRAIFPRFTVVAFCAPR